MRSVPIFFVLLCVISASAIGSSIDTDNLQWSVQYLLDTSQSDFGESQSPGPRDNRGLAISPDGRYLYAGYNNSNGGQEYQVRKIDLTQSDYIDASVARVTGVRGKSIAVDDCGRVYLGEGSSIKVYDADLTTVLYSISTTECEGVDVRREGSTLALYATDRSNGTLSRYELTESGSTITGHSLGGLDGTGQISVTGATSLRGVGVDDSGRIWMADKSGDKVFRVDADGSNLTFVSVDDAIDIDFDASRAFVTQYTSRTISVLDSAMNLVDTISVPWAGLELDEDGQSGYGALSGIVVLDGEGFYVSNESGQTANEKSMYGRDDDNSGVWEISEGGDGRYYQDLYYDDNDPILFAVPEPATLALLLGGVLLLKRQKRRDR